MIMNNLIITSKSLVYKIMLIKMPYYTLSAYWVVQQARTCECLVFYDDCEHMLWNSGRGGWLDRNIRGKEIYCGQTVINGK